MFIHCKSGHFCCTQAAGISSPSSSISQQQSSESLNEPALCSSVLASPTPAMSVPLPSPRTSAATFSSVSKMREFLASHPKSQRYFVDGATHDVIAQRQVVVAVSTAKLVEECGMYPSQVDKKRLAEVLGEIMHMIPNVFFDSASHQGYISNALHNRRRKLATSEKKFTWSDARKRLKMPSDNVCIPEHSESDKSSPQGNAFFSHGFTLQMKYNFLVIKVLFLKFFIRIGGI